MKVKIMSQEAWDKEFFNLIAEASKAFTGFYRKGKNPTMGLKIPACIHFLQVLQKLERWGICNLEEHQKVLWKAVIFHDVLEDCPNYDSVRLKRLIGKKAFKIVQEMTNTFESKAQYLNSFKSKSTQALIAKIADRISNTLDFREDSPKYARKYFFKAQILFDLFLERKSEIIQLYGQNVYDNILEEIEEMELNFHSEASLA